MRGAAVPVALIVFGLAGLAWYYGLFPDVETLVVAGLVCAGAAVLLVEGLTKTSVVWGPSLIAAGSVLALHEHRGVSWNALIPAMLVVVGVLMLIARSPSIPERSLHRGGDAPEAAERN